MEPVVEDSLRSIGLFKIAGVDEAGRGPMAGPVVVACVMLAANHNLEGLNDSKKVSAKKREILYPLIFERAISVTVASASNVSIDAINIYQATKRCIAEVVNTSQGSPEIVVIDGEFTAFSGDCALRFPYQTLPKGDALSENVAAASIIAKVSRDYWMTEVAHVQYPMYGFDKHKGYGTKEHIEALKKYGPCPLHRRSFTLHGVKLEELT